MNWVQLISRKLLLSSLQNPGYASLSLQHQIPILSSISMIPLTGRFSGKAPYYSRRRVVLKSVWHEKSFPALIQTYLDHICIMPHHFLHTTSKYPQGKAIWDLTLVELLDARWLWPVWGQRHSQPSCQIFACMERKWLTRRESWSSSCGEIRNVRK